LQRAENRSKNTPEMLLDLAELVVAWPHLPEAVKTGIMAMVATSRGR